MSIKQIIEDLYHYKWNGEDITYVVLYIIIASMLTTPILGIPIGFAVFYWLNFKKDKDNEKDKSEEDNINN